MLNTASAQHMCGCHVLDKSNNAWQVGRWSPSLAKTKMGLKSVSWRRAESKQIARKTPLILSLAIEHSCQKPRVRNSYCLDFIENCKKVLEE